MSDPKILKQGPGWSISEDGPVAVPRVGGSERYRSTPCGDAIEAKDARDVRIARQGALEALREFQAGMDEDSGAFMIGPDLRQRLIALLERIERDDQVAEYASDCELAACLAELRK